mgnify:CR=1 FL=1
MMVAGTIGAGVLSLPYAISHAGLPFGLLLIVILGGLMIGLNLLLGEVIERTRGKMQLAGLAHKYLGRTGGVLMTMVFYLMLLGAITVYIIGEGETLTALFGGSPIFWSLGFAGLVFLLVYIGIDAIRKVEFFFSIGVIGIIVLIGLFGTKFMVPTHFTYYNWANILLPYGVILFAFHGTSSVVEAHTLVGRRGKIFRKSIIWAGAIVMLAYLFFTAAVVGVTGLGTTEIATIGLGHVVGPMIFYLGNIFAALAMFTCCLMASTSLRDSLSWDYRISRGPATLLVCGIPLLIFLFGVRAFTAAIDLVGGVFVSLELILIILIYFRAKKFGDVSPGQYHLNYALPFAILLLLIFSIGTVYGVVKIF